MKVIDLNRKDAIKLMAFAVDARKVLIGLKDEYLKEIKFLKEMKV